MLHTLDMVRMNIRNRDGKRVFYLGKGDQLTSGAREFLTRERIEILPAQEAKRAMAPETSGSRRLPDVTFPMEIRRGAITGRSAPIRLQRVSIVSEARP